MGYEPGWFGAFTRQQGEDCWPSGSRVRKAKEDPGGDSTPLGTLGLVLGSISHPALGKLYFVEWDNKPKQAVACVGWKLELAPHA